MSNVTPLNATAPARAPIPGPDLQRVEQFRESMRAAREVIAARSIESICEMHRASYAEVKADLAQSNGEVESLKNALADEYEALDGILANYLEQGRHAEKVADEAEKGMMRTVQTKT